MSYNFLYKWNKIFNNFIKMNLKVNYFKINNWINSLNYYKLPVIFIKCKRSRNKVNVLESVFRDINFSLIIKYFIYNKKIIISIKFNYKIKKKYLYK